MGKPSKVTEAVTGRVCGDPGPSIYCPAKLQPPGQARQAHLYRLRRTSGGPITGHSPASSVCPLTLSQVN